MYVINRDVSDDPVRPDLPAVVLSPKSGTNLANWLKDSCDWMEIAVLQHGAVLLRGFTMDGVEDFSRAVDTLIDEKLRYVYRSTTRVEKADRIYTATEYPAGQTITMHNENAYQADWPLKLVFYCKTPATTGGETPLSWNSRVTEQITHLIPRFARLGIRYVRNYPDAGVSTGLPTLDLTWQNVFQTDSKVDVEQFAAANGINLEWKSSGGLRTWQVLPALATHPRNGKLVWFNQAHVMHISNVEPRSRAELQRMFSTEDLPRNCYYGDGSQIDPAGLDLIRQAYIESRQLFKWEAGDVLVVDNMQVAHGRMPYTGHREVLLAMGESYRQATANSANAP